MVTTPLRITIPVQPDAETARTWVEEELTAPEYASQGVNWLEKLIAWIQDLIARVQNLGGDGALGNLWEWLGIAVLSAGFAVGGFFLYRQVRNQRRERSVAPELFSAAPKSSAELRLEAERAVLSEDWSTATITRYRALIKGLMERGIVPEITGITALEAAHLAGFSFPQQKPDLERGAAKFDAIRYGALPAQRPDYDQIKQLDEAISTARVTVAP